MQSLTLLLQKAGDKIVGTPTDEDSQSTEGEAETASLSLVDFRIRLQV